MAIQTKRATIYFDPDLHNEAAKEALAEDAEDLLAFDERANEPLISSALDF